MNHPDRGRTISEPGSGPRSQPFGQYVLLRKLAAGGMAEIFLAKQTGISGFERLVVVKRILPHLAENREFITMFLDEARIAAQLTHPNVVQIYDMGRVMDAASAEGRAAQYYIAMEYIHGEDIRKIYNQEVQRAARIPLHFAAHLVAQAAHGLDYAHRKADISGTPLGLVHRDVSPQNMLVTYDGHVKIVDFGVAKATNKVAQTRSGVLKGKYSYMSPEQAQGIKIDARTDTFALGVVLYEVTCGTRLFKRENELETLHAVIACDVPPPSRIDPNFPAALERIIMKALSKNPSRRQQTAGELGRELEDFNKEIDRVVGAADVASYMQELFADKLAEELLVGPGMWDEDHTNEARKVEQRAERGSRSGGGTKFLGEDGEDGAGMRDANDGHEADASFSGGEPPTRRDSRGSGPSRTFADSQSDDSGADSQRSDWSERARTPASEGMSLEMSRPTDAATRLGALAALDQPRTVASPTDVARPRETGSASPIPWPLIASALGGAAVVAMFVALFVSSGRDQAAESGPTFFESRPPGATIYIDGLRLAEGKTPLVLGRPLDVGPHHVKFELEAHEPAEGVFYAQKGGKNTFDRELRMMPETAKPPDAKPSEAPPVPTPVPVPDKKPAPPRAPGQLSVKASLPLKIFLGKQALGSTPLTRGIPAGTHQLRGVHTQSGWAESRKLVVEAGGQARVDFVVPVGKLRVNIQPFGNVRIGSWIGETPLAPIDLPAGKYTVKLWNAELGKDESTQVKIVEGQETGLERNWTK